MPKPRAGTSSRKPPEPAASHAVVDAWMEDVMPRLQPLVAHLDRKIRRAIPGLQFAVKWKKAYYGLPDRGWLMELVAYDVSVNLVFFAGARFDPPPPLGEGSRYVKLHGLDEARAGEVADWIRQAARHDGWR